MSGVEYQELGIAQESDIMVTAMKMKLFSQLLACTLMSSGLFVDASEQHDKVNIIYVLADDLGYGDLGCYGSKLNATPQIDALAAGGLRMTDFHASAWCAPSRRGLMTGCHPNRPWKNTKGQWGRLADAIVIPELLKTVGYRTALIGKWHLEMSEGLHPLDQGFDYWCGTRGSNDWDGPAPNYESFRSASEESWKTPLYVNRENLGPVVSQSGFTKRYTEEVIDIIKSEDQKPFFIYLAHNMPHVPVFASKQFQGVSKNGVYGDVLSELDWSIGQIVETLEATGKRENTMVVFTSDNGPWSMFTEFSGIASPLRGQKSTTWEGGTRVPFIVSWPGNVKSGDHAGLMTHYDVYATLASIVGVAIPDGHAIDSIDMSEVWRTGVASPRTKHVYYFRDAMAYRSGDYKIHLKTRERTREPETGKREPSIQQEPPLVFNLRKDMGEKRDIQRKSQEVTNRLLKEFEMARQKIQSWEPF